LGTVAVFNSSAHRRAPPELRHVHACARGHDP